MLTEWYIHRSHFTLLLSKFFLNHDFINFTTGKPNFINLQFEKKKKANCLYTSHLPWGLWCHVKCIQMSKWQGANCSVASKWTAWVFSQQDLSLVPVSPFIPASCRARENLCSKTRHLWPWPLPDRSFTSSLGRTGLRRECLVLGTRLLCLED